jgi:hypothetical protein
MQDTLTVCNVATAKYFQYLPKEGSSIQPVNPDIFGEQSKPLLFQRSRLEMTSATGRGLMPIDQHLNVK